jgi:undecaprenyl-diphosphatase
MSATKEWNCLGYAWVVLIISLIVRLIISNQFLLVPDEVNYWQWSRYLDLGYHDHPPMVAWTIWLSTKLFGQNEFAVRLPSVLGLFIASIYMILLAGRWFSWRCALHTAVLTQGILLFNGTALIATPDGMLLPCWAAACYHAGRALERGNSPQWLLTGIWFGLGLLSKYTMLLFLPSIFIYILLSKENREKLLTPSPWLGLILSFLIFSPVIIWNSRNEWATFRHVLYMGGVDSKALFTSQYIGDYFASQAALVSPVIFILILTAWFSSYKHKRLRYDDAKYLYWTSLTTFLVFLLLSLHSRVYGNWSAPAYVTAVILVAALYSPGRISYKNSTGNSAWKIGVFTCYLLTFPVLIQVVYPILPIPVDLDRTARETVGWDMLGDKVHQTLQKMNAPENTFIFGLRYQIASELAFYMPSQPRTVSINQWNRPNVYDFWFTDEMLVGKDGIGVSRSKTIAPKLSQLFERMDPPEEFNIYRTSPWRGKELVQTLYIYKGYGFKGGIRWQPPDTNDIRATLNQVAQ